MDESYIISHNWTITTTQEELDSFGNDGLVEIGLE